MTRLNRCTGNRPCIVYSIGAGEVGAGFGGYLKNSLDTKKAIQWTSLRGKPEFLPHSVLHSFLSLVPPPLHTKIIIHFLQSLVGFKPSEKFQHSHINWIGPKVPCIYFNKAYVGYTKTNISITDINTTSPLWLKHCHQKVAVLQNRATPRLYKTQRVLETRGQYAIFHCVQHNIAAPCETNGS